MRSLELLLSILIGYYIYYFLTFGSLFSYTCGSAAIARVIDTCGSLKRNTVYNCVII